MKKVFSLLGLVVLIACLAQPLLAQSALPTIGSKTTVQWDASTDPTVTAYDIVLTTTNVTATQLGATNTVAVANGVLGAAVRTSATQVAITSLYTTTPTNGTYSTWGRCVIVVDTTGTNNMFSDWVSINGQWYNKPNPPNNLRFK